MRNEMVALSFIAAILGGCLGAKLAKSLPWKGALVAFASIIASQAAATLFQTQSLFISILCTLVAAGIVGGALKMHGRQIGMVIIGSILGFAFVAAVAQAITSH